MKSLSMRRSILWVKLVMFARPQPKSTSGWWYCSSVSSPTQFTKSSASWKFAKRNSPQVVPADYLPSEQLARKLLDLFLLERRHAAPARYARLACEVGH